MRANWAVMCIGLAALARPAWAADTERKVDPTFLHRNTASAREASSDDKPDAPPVSPRIVAEKFGSTEWSEKSTLPS